VEIIVSAGKQGSDLFYKIESRKESKK